MTEQSVLMEVIQRFGHIVYIATLEDGSTYIEAEMCCGNINATFRYDGKALDLDAYQ